MRSRYAPSPTGPLHLGNIRTALITWLHAKLTNAELYLRFDDLDTPRNRSGSVEQIQADLLWLGLDFCPDIYFQSNQLTDYEEAFDQLLNRNLIYPCRCSRKEIQNVASPPDSRFAAGRYPGTCHPDKKIQAITESDQLAWRFMLADEHLSFEDQIAGKQTENPWQQTGDFVIKRKDGFFAYQLATVIDDRNLDITHVIRGIDLIDSTCRQLALYKAFDIHPPEYWHVPLMLDQNGEKLSKRDGAISLAVYQRQGKRAEDIIGLLAKSLGLIDQETRLSATELLSAISLEKLQASLKKASVVN